MIPAKEFRLKILQEAWEKIDALIVPGELPGNGTDGTAERNGLILASNILQQMMRETKEEL